MRIRFLVLGFLLIVSQLKAQHDSTYFKTFPTKLSAGSFIALRNYSLFIAPQIDGSAVDSLRSRYQPNASRIVGVSLHLDRIGVNLSVSVPDAFKSQEIYGTSRRLEGNLNLYRKSGIFAGQLIGTQGFADKNSVNYLDQVLDEDQFYVRQDLTVWNGIASYMHFWNWKKFSARAVFPFAERQLKSAGSLINSIQIRHFRVIADSSILPYPTRPYYEQLNNINDIRFNELSIGVGYAYTFVFDERWFIHGTAIIKGTAQRQKHRELGNDYNFRYVINPAAEYRLSAGYSEDLFFLAILFAGYSDLYNLPDIEMAWGYFNFSINFGVRIPTPRKVNRVYRSAIPR